jgi:hypothetical protein
MSKLMRAQEAIFAGESKGRAIRSMKPSDLQQAPVVGAGVNP